MIEDVEIIEETSNGDEMIPPVTLRDIVGGEEDMGEGKTRRTRKSDLHMNSALNVLEEENEQLNYN